MAKLEKLAGIALPREEDLEPYAQAMLVALKRTMVTVDVLVDEVEELKHPKEAHQFKPAYQNYR